MNGPQIDLPCDIQQTDDFGHPWAFLDDATDPSIIKEGTVIISGDRREPRLARVISMTEQPSGTKVHLELLKDSKPYGPVFGFDGRLYYIRNRG